MLAVVQYYFMGEFIKKAININYASVLITDTEPH